MSIRNILIFVGPPGAGKGSLSQKCVFELGWKQVSTGDLCRRHIQDRTEIGNEIDFAIKSGKLVSDNLITQMVAEWLAEQANKNIDSLILDGYPRTLKQAELFDQILKEKFPSLKVRLIKLQISDDLVTSRLLSRSLCSNKECQAVYSTRQESGLTPKQTNICDKCGAELSKRADDLVETVKERIKSYRFHEQALLQFYENNQVKIYQINAGQKLDQVFDDLKGLL